MQTLICVGIKKHEKQQDCIKMYYQFYKGITFTYFIPAYYDK
jgi:hypothetical protein